METIDPLRLLVEQDGFFTRSQALDLGHDDRAVAAMVRQRVWHRFRRGYYTFADTWRALDEVGRHRVRSRAVMDSLGDRVALSHVSALVAHGVEVWDVNLSRVHVTRLDGAPGRVEGDVVHHVGACDPDTLATVDGLGVVDPVRCALETASRTSSEGALVILDSLLCQGHTTYDDLQVAFVELRHWPFTRHLHLVVRMADAGAQSPGESRGRFLFRSARLPEPVLQHAVHAADGTLLGTCDWGWPQHGVLGEFDGRVKYGRLLAPGVESGDVVFAEKQREDRIREATGMTMVRVTWGDLDRPRVTARRLERLLHRAS